MTVRFTRNQLQDAARTVTWRNSKTDFVTDLLQAIGFPEGFTVMTAEDLPVPILTSACVTTLVTLEPVHAWICIDALRRQGSIFNDAGNPNAARACRTLAEELYAASKALDSRDYVAEKPKPMTRYDRIGGDDEE